jgi:signal transduction histidine kinase
VSGFTYAPTPGGEHVIAYTPVPLAEWALILEEPWENVASPLLDISMAAPLALAPALVVALIGLWFGARSVILPLRELERQAIRISGGETGTGFPSVRGIGEIRQLQRTLREMADRVTAANRALRGYIGRITEAQEEERQRISRELHDETVQQLIVLDQRLQLLDADLREHGHIERGQLTDLRDAAGKTIRGIRRLSRGLRPDYLEDLGLSAALGVLAGEAQAAYGTPTAFEAQGTAYRLSPETELAVYRVAQEALSNMGRHASARQVQVRLSFDASALRLSVCDDGGGFDMPEDVEELGKKGHWGLIGMRERAGSVGGRLDVVSAPGRGTRIELTVAPQGR